MLKLLASVLPLVVTLHGAPNGIEKPPILVPPVKDDGPLKLMLYVPGGKVPPQDYLPMIKDAQSKSSLRLAAAIIQCHVNLCDPIFEGPGLMKTAIDIAKKTWGSFQTADIFVMGHSLGGVGARHFYDGFPGTAGLALFGTQYNGDHEDYKGTLGYPVDLAKFSGPLLALTGELDMVPTSHTAELVRQAQSFGEKERFSKLPIIVAGMDHSQFCPPFQVSGDLKPEISNDEATDAVGTVLASWLDYVTIGSSLVAGRDVGSVLQGWIKKTEPIAAPFISAMEADHTWCASAQKLLAGSPEHLEVVLEECFDTPNLEHCHTASTMDGDNLKVSDCFYRFYSYTNATIPSLVPKYEGADDISCKMISEDRIATMLKLPVPTMDSDDVKNKCAFLNQKVWEKAKELVKATWPKSLQRFEKRGKKITFKDDSQSFLGPQWVLTGLSVKETRDEITVQSEALISSITSKIYPGNHYCKLLAPSKAVEMIMTTSLTQRYASMTDVIV